MWQGQDGNKIIKLYNIFVYQNNLNIKNFFTHEETIIEIKYEIFKEITGLIVGVKILSITGEVIAYSRVDDYISEEEIYSKPKLHTRKLVIPQNTFSDGKFIINIDIGIHNVTRIIDKSLILQFINTNGIGRKYLVTGKEFENMFRLNWAWK